MSSAQTMKIYSIIARIEEELEESPRTKFAGAANKRIVEIERLFDLISDLKVTIPEDIRRATGILAEAQNTIQDAKENADDIMESAKKEADEILQNAQTSAENIYRKAQVEYENRISNANVYQEALKRANAISEEAENNANAIYNGARKYADEILADLQSYICEYHKMIDANRNELNVTPAAKRPLAPETQPAKEFSDQVVLKQPVKAPETVESSNPPYVPPVQEPMYNRDQPMIEEDYYDDSYDDEPIKPVKDMNKGPKKQQEPIYDDDYDDFEDDEDLKPKKKKGIFSRMFEVEDDEYDDYDDYDDFDDEPVKQKKKSKR